MVVHEELHISHETHQQYVLKHIFSVILLKYDHMACIKTYCTESFTLITLSQFIVVYIQLPCLANYFQEMMKLNTYLLPEVPGVYRSEHYHHHCLCPLQWNGAQVDQ